MKLPERQDFLDYAEGTPGQNSDTQRRIMNLLASSPVMREQLAELKRDLYYVSAQIPEYQPDAPFGAELARLSQNWVQLQYSRKFSIKNFYRSAEFFGLLSLVAAALILLLVFLGWRLLR